MIRDVLFSLPPSPLFLVSWYGDSRGESSASLGLDGAGGGGGRDGRRGRGGGAGRGGRRRRVGVTVALGVVAVEAALEGPGVRRRRADALGRAAAAAVASRGREAPPHLARRRRRGPRGGCRAAMVAVEPALLAGCVDVVGRHAQFLRVSLRSADAKKKERCHNTKFHVANVAERIITSTDVSTKACNKCQNKYKISE